MELEAMKQIWQRYDENVQKNNSLNDTIIKKMLQQNSKNIISKMIGFEYLNLTISGILTLLLLAGGYYFLHLPGVEGILTLCYFVSLVCAATALLANMYMIYFLNNTDLSKPVADNLIRMDKLTRFTTQSKIFNLILLPIFVLATVPVGRKLVYNENIFEKMHFWWPLLLAALTLGVIATVLLYRTFYTNRVKAIKENLNEIESYEHY